MKIVHICQSDATGGATRAAFDILAGQRDAGIDARLIAAKVYSKHDDHVIALAPPKGLLNRIGHRLSDRRRVRSLLPYQKTMLRTCGEFVVANAGIGAEIAELVGPADLIHLHWTGGFLNISKALPALAALAPVVWTPQDMEVMTGGCAIPLACLRYLERCGTCPELGSTEEDDLSRRNWLTKASGLAKVSSARVHTVGVSTWMRERVLASSLLGRFPCDLISSSVNTDSFTPGSVADARRALGIPLQARVVLFVTSHIGIKTKGYSYLHAALEQLRGVPDLFLLSVGKTNPDSPEDVAHKHLGQVRDDVMLANAYRAATVFANPTIWETFGLTTVEAMACGTPVVGYDTTGLKDTIDDGVTGFRVPSKDVNALADGLRHVLLDADLRERMSQASLARVRTRFTRDVQTKAYLALYERLLATNR